MAPSWNVPKAMTLTRRFSYRSLPKSHNGNQRLPPWAPESPSLAEYHSRLALLLPSCPPHLTMINYMLLVSRQGPIISIGGEASVLTENPQGRFVCQNGTRRCPRRPKRRSSKTSRNLFSPDGRACVISWSIRVRCVLAFNGPGGG